MMKRIPLVDWAEHSAVQGQSYDHDNDHVRCFFEQNEGER